jgi:hypothetical protein
MAVIVALSAVLLFSVAALCVDLGNAYSRKRSLQTQADFAAFAAVKGGANLPAATTTPLASQDAVIQAAAYLNRNLPQDDAQGPRTCEAATPPTCITAAQLVNGRLADGEVKYGHYVGGLSGTFVASKNEITVITPKSLVDYGLAQAMGPGHDSLNLQTKATVAIKSAKISTLPFYAYTGCDYGPQTISEPNNGHAATTVNLSHASESNAATLTTLNPVTVIYNDTTNSLTITGSNLGSVTQVGFFESGNSTAGPEPVTVDVLTDAAHRTNTMVKIDAPLPAAVTGVQNVWYVRVKIGPDWSSVTNGNGANATLMALPFTIGNALLTCGQGSNDGNFGTLKFQSTGQWEETARNIATGLDHELDTFPTPVPNYLCSATTPLPVRTVLWPNEGTNCVDTETGMSQNAATAGFVTGLTTGGYNFAGLLTRTTAGTGCASNGTPVTKSLLGKTINNDTLSCFFLNTTTNVGQITGSTYTQPGPVLDQKIWSSPRMVFVPVLGIEPSSGGSNKYQIIDFRPGFVTDQTETAVKATPATLNNGLTLSSNGSDVQSVQIVFFNPKALPDPPGGIAVSDYIAGKGPKIVRLID